jgi:hypothetical protein
MSEQVRAYFPNAPNRCVDCPALEAAANRLEYYFSLATESSTSNDNPANPLVSGEDYLASLLTDEEAARATIPRFLTDLTVDENIAITAIAEQLYADCSDGALDKTEPRIERRGFLQKPQRIIATTRACQSLSRIGAFIPAIYYEHERI